MPPMSPPPPGATIPSGTTILVRSGWQTVNIGDIAHTPGLLSVLERHAPHASVILWPSRLDRGVEPMLRRRFPKLRIVRDGMWRGGDPRSDDPTADLAIAEAAVLIHGSGAGIYGGATELRRWREAGGKPYGAFGVTLGSGIGDAQHRPSLEPQLRELIDHAAFIFTRETRSLGLLRDSGVSGPYLGFAPDATFAIDLRDDAAAQRLMDAHRLDDDRFICVVPRLRITPYWEIHGHTNLAPEEIARRTEINRHHADPDHAKVRYAIVAWVRQTGGRVLLCPEMTYQVGIIRPLLFDPLPDDVKPSVACMDRYWLPDEAASIYRRARMVLSMECHSPIIALANGRPAFYLAQPEDTWKGQMYPDLGLADWRLDLQSIEGTAIAERMLGVHEGYEDALAKARDAKALADAKHAHAIGVVGRILAGDKVP